VRQPTSVLINIVRSAPSSTEYLLLHRKPTSYGEEPIWQGVTGGVEDNESLEDTARRELSEETGFVPISLRSIGFSYCFPILEQLNPSFPAGTTENREHAFLAEVLGGIEPVLSDEHDSFRWCDIEDALSLLKYPNNIEALQRSNESLLGWRLLQLVEHNPTWLTEFQALHDVLSTELFPLVKAIHHVGSTSIPGLLAKPILDVDVEIADYTNFSIVVHYLERLGYIYQGEQGVQDRHAFSQVDQSAPRCSPHREWITQHLYVCPSWSKELQRHLLFRDYLRSNADARQEYASIKRSVAVVSGRDRKAYANIKEERARTFVESVIFKASLY
jgi:GrpB-like predicted nucleotidyltransferase (UPF0157 family)/ADP-ribose pyrophosphatase YjhB (NUDIX family)